MNLLKSILDWPTFWSSLNDAGIDAVFYFFFASIATFLFLIRMGITLFFGGDADAGMELDVDIADVDGDFESDHTFGVLSIQSVLAFFMGAGWMGLIARFDWQLGRIATGVAAVVFGLILMSFSVWLMLMVRRLEKTNPYDVKSAIGHTGRVYMNIPEKGQGAGQVEVSVSGRKKIMSAVSDDQAIESFTSVKIIGARDDETLIVEVPQD
ncbi:MAG TPA: hypothetical protein DCM28_18705 [Phycisphaerales bacterium]|nr:hypothetical protein [Phycisphaerales bacterium]HCD34281.1 hypothetical protein [Phycisphaerales bacterium]|tara:strand:- start:1478 stop:2107 length:630 start_codon:yes stop_codon:yes gene_type:complete